MSYKTELQGNNADLQTLLTKINALPEAGGGGGAVETCTLTIDVTEGHDISTIVYTTVAEGRVVPVLVDGRQAVDGMANNGVVTLLCAKNSLVVAEVYEEATHTLQGGITQVYSNFVGGRYYFISGDATDKVVAWDL